MSAPRTDIETLGRRLAAGEALDEADVLSLMTSTDILALAMLADAARRTRHGDTVTFVRVADVALPGSGQAVEIAPSAREVRVLPAAGGVNVALPGLRAVVLAAGGVPVTAYSLAALAAEAKADGLGLQDACAMLRDSGVSAVAEAALDELDEAEAAFSAVRAAGLDVARVVVRRNTDAVGRVVLLRTLAAVQRAAGPVRSYAPLARVWTASAPSTGYEDVRQIAVSRLCAPDVPTIQVDWSLYGPKLAQVALTMGADDLDGVTAVDEAPDGVRRAPLEEVRRNIRAAALTPQERDARFAIVGG
jgi:aminodeoxyfutalosine synthase